MINICNWRITVYNKHTYIIIICTYLQRVIAIHAKRYIQLSKTAFLTISPAQVSATSASVVKRTLDLERAKPDIFLPRYWIQSNSLKKNNVKFYNACNLFQIWTAILSFPHHYRYLRPLVYHWNRDELNNCYSVLIYTQNITSQNLENQKYLLLWCAGIITKHQLVKL